MHGSFIMYKNVVKREKVEYMRNRLFWDYSSKNK